MQKLREAVEYAFCCVFGFICLSIIYGYATFLSALELARIVKPFYLQPSARQPYNSPTERQPMLYGSLIDK
ncbi:hypothetical protein RY831_30985 [Noviherbaspirillum sp. CPCC 100848]|uniref:Uncharacterized protein n=1 Tax=Noviherbaspirillum album TaxID=3080276 RepID=A0ABU6JK26_9BURK|nr:hypothetical protein [Noviherbaspirillum sp. CPCC 100848]MEC4723567.1 hypothetical protein [Noviherbaspirillum sp. CPCC 100848]